jgi:hypothetical protein
MGYLDALPKNTNTVDKLNSMKVKLSTLTK